MASWLTRLPLSHMQVPSIERLARMSDAQLRAVPRLVVGRSGVGEVTFLYPGRCRAGICRRGGCFMHAAAV